MMRRVVPLRHGPDHSHAFPRGCAIQKPEPTELQKWGEAKVGSVWGTAPVLATVRRWPPIRELPACLSSPESRLLLPFQRTIGKFGIPASYGRGDAGGFEPPRRLKRIPSIAVADQHPMDLPSMVLRRSHFNGSHVVPPVLKTVLPQVLQKRRFERSVALRGDCSLLLEIRECPSSIQGQRAHSASHVDSTGPIWKLSPEMRVRPYVCNMLYTDLHPSC